MNPGQNHSLVKEHWLYKRARENWENTQQRQIKKGERTYDKPLGDAEWTWREVINHAVEENVDQMHYIQLLQVKLEELELENITLKARLDQLENK